MSYYTQLKRVKYYSCPTSEHFNVNHHDDFEEFHIPMSRMHNSNLHDWGIASGLEVSVVASGIDIDVDSIDVDSGVAIDANGQLISLPQKHSGLKDSTKNGKTVYVTIRYGAKSEIDSPGTPCNKKIINDPVIELQEPSGYTPGTQIILATAVIDAAGKITISNDKRRLIGGTLGELRIWRSSNEVNRIQEIPSGKIGPGDGGGLRITVPNAGDGILFARDDGLNFTKLEIRSDNLSVNGNVGIGTTNAPAQLIVDGKVTANQGFFGNSAGTTNPILEAIGFPETQIETTYVRSPSNAGKIYFQSNCKKTALMIDTSSGNVGIGTDKPSARLSVKGTPPFDVLGVSIQNNSNIVTGTSFAQVSVGDKIKIGGETKTIIEFKGNYLFSWDNVPGNESYRLKEFLNKNYSIGIITEEFKKIDDGNTITLPFGENLISLGLNYEKTEVNLRIEDGRTYEFKVRTEKDQLKIYDETSLITDSNFSSTVSNTKMIVLPNIFRVDDSLGTTKFIISRDGDVGIGTNDPRHKLHVDGNVYASKFIGNGTELTELNASNITTGKLAGSLIDPHTHTGYATDPHTHTGYATDPHTHTDLNVNSLRINNNGALFKEFKAGRVYIGPNPDGKNTITKKVCFEQPFSGAKENIHVIVTARGANKEPTFAASTSTVETTHFKVNVANVEKDKWIQELYLDWLAWEQLGDSAKECPGGGGDGGGGGNTPCALPF